ncbi:oligosaccharide flippase family protein [Curtobacterium flaccumfaciens pv. beticola]|uniref:lipopolysaccharide biosynthesis protein n=1 Tax=Curtobacterium flaccumfaciens TaxID=2035 RepID=UPI00349FA3A5|nr:oligosaccharide flippase family protein [Curtobacterium flaccumfaciens pv. basellae]
MRPPTLRRLISPFSSPHKKVVLAQAIGQASVLAATPVLGRLMPVHELGIYQTALAIALVLQPLATLRVDFVLPGVEDDATARQLLTRGRLAGVVLLTVAALVGVLFVFLDNHDYAEIAVSAGVLALAYSWIALDGGQFLRTQALSALTARNLASGLSAAVLQCAAALLFPTALALTAAIVLARVIAIAVSRSKAPRFVLTSGSANRATYPLGRTFRAVLSSLLDTSILQSLVLVPGTVLGPAAAGYAGMSQRITTSPASLVVGGMGQVAQAKMSVSLRAGSSAMSSLRRAALGLGIVAISLGTLVALVAPLLVVPVLGPAWRPLQQLLPITAPALAAQVLSLTLVPIGVMLRAEGKLLVVNLMRFAVIVGGTVAVALVSRDLVLTVSAWSAATTAGYIAQLCFIFQAARRNDRAGVDQRDAEDTGASPATSGV